MQDKGLSVDAVSLAEGMTKVQAKAQELFSAVSNEEAAPQGTVETITCPRCGGTGKKSQEEIQAEMSRFGAGSGVHKIDMKCPQCGGTGVIQVRK